MLMMIIWHCQQSGCLCLWWWCGDSSNADLFGLGVVVVVVVVKLPSEAETFLFRCCSVVKRLRMCGGADCNEQMSILGDEDAVS